MILRSIFSRQQSSTVMNKSPLSHNGKDHVPVPSGEYVVGATDVMVGPDVLEGCFLRLYYPTEHTDAYEHSHRWASWIPHPNYIKGYASVFGLPFIGRRLISWAFGNLWVPVVVDAQPISGKEQFPLIVFSHGLSACRTSYSVICSELASHGFVVAATEHREGSACMSYHLVKESDNNEEAGYIEDWIQYKAMEFEKEDMPLRKEQLLQRIRECQKTLDLLLKINEGHNIEHVLKTGVELVKFKGLMDVSKPVLAGHSFGSATVLRTLAVDKRFKIGVALDAWLWPLRDEEELAKKVDQPVLFINMEAFQNMNNLNTMKKFVEDVDHTERSVITLKGSVHKNQVDLPLMLPPYLRRVAGAHSNIDPHIAMQLNNCITLLYLRKHLGQPIDGEHAKFVDTYKHLLYEGISAQ